MTLVSIPIPLDAEWDAATWLTAHGGYTLDSFEVQRTCWVLDLAETLTAAQQVALAHALGMEQFLAGGAAIDPALTDGGILLGSGTGDITALAQMADSELVVGTGAGDPVPESGGTLRTSLGIGIGDTLELAGLGIGTSTPDRPLDIASTSASMQQTRWSNTAGAGAGMIIQRSRGASVDEDTVVQAEDNVALINFKAYDGGAFANVARIQVYVDGAPGSGDMPGRMVFGTTADGSSSNTERMRIDSGGVVSITGSLTITTDLAVAEGGTGASALVDGGILLGSGTGAVTALPQMADSEILVGTGAGDPVAESGATLRTSLGLGTGDTVALTALTTSAGYQATATAVVATSGGASIASNVSVVTTTVTTDADDVVILPPPVVGVKIRLYVGATGHEIRTVAASNVLVNNVDCDGTNELALAANSSVIFECISATAWIAYGRNNLGADLAALVPDAA